MKIITVTKKEVAQLMRKCDGDSQKERQLLQHVFQFKENINTFAEFFFPESVSNAIPDFHGEIYEILFKPSNDALAAPRGHAKLCSDSTKVLTPQGWRNHGDLQVNDYVYSNSGKHVKVLAKTPKSFANYVVTMMNGGKIRCHKNHEWTVFNRNKKKWETIDTYEMIGEYNRAQYQLPNIKAIKHPSKNLTIDPYYLGLWLGDGNYDAPRLSMTKNDIDEIEPTLEYDFNKKYTHPTTGVVSAYSTHQGVIQKIRMLNLYKNKHIPHIYLFSDISQRLELLAGLLDSDGHVDKKRGRCRFVNTNKKIIDGVMELTTSLGFRPYLTSQEAPPHGGMKFNKKCYTVNFNPTLNIPTRLKRKHITRCIGQKRVGIKSVEYLPNGEMGNCIEVDSPDGLYLVGKELYPTHNSTITGIFFIIFCIVNKLEDYIVYISQNHAKTVQFLDPIRQEFKTNKLLKYVYGDLSPKSTRDDTGKDREDCFDVNGTRVEAVSFEKNLRGFKYGNKRPTLIIGDDIEDDVRTLNPELRMKDKNKLNKVIIPALDIDGKFKMIGTLLHYDSLLQDKIKLYGGKIFRACDENINGILWPERFTKEKLTGIRHDIGSIPFQQEYLNNPIDNTSSLIKREWIEQCFDETISHDDIQKKNNNNDFELKVLGCDFAFADRITSDTSPFLGLAKDANVDAYYLLNLSIHKGLSINEQMNIIKNVLHEKYRYDKIGLEENSIKAISKDIKQWNLPITLFWTAAADPAARLKPGYDWNEKRHTVGKLNLIMRLSTAFENKQFIIPYKTEEDKSVADKILSECTSWALSEGKLVEAGVHPDIPIAMGYALELINNNNVVMDFG